MCVCCVYRAEKVNLAERKTNNERGKKAKNLWENIDLVAK